MPKCYDATEVDAAFEKLEDDYGGTSFIAGIYTAHSTIRKIKTADVAPVVHAHWETIYNDCGHYGFVKCSACGDEYGSLTYRYCPNCGAKMDEKE